MPRKKRHIDKKEQQYFVYIDFERRFQNFFALATASKSMKKLLKNDLGVEIFEIM